MVLFYGAHLCGTGDSNLETERENCAFLSSYYTPQVNTKAAGKAALHCAAAGGNIDVIKTLLEFHPDLEIEVCSL